MRALVLYCHPRPDSYTAAVRDVILSELDEAGAEYRLRDLYEEGFEPVLSATAHAAYEDKARNQRGIETHVADLEWCDTLVFVYPTWWYGLPAMLKGWLDRVLVPGVAFHMPDGPRAQIRPGLGNVCAIAVFTTCGASWWLTRVIGFPGKRTLLRGLRLMCARRCRKLFVAHYLMDSSTQVSRAQHLDHVAQRMRRFAGQRPKAREVTA